MARMLWCVSQVGLIAAIGVALPQAAHAQAGEAEVTFDIPAGPLAEVLRRYSEATGVQLVYSSALVEGRSSPGVSGSFSKEEALRRLLAGSGLSARFAGNTATIEGASGGERVLGAVRVEGVQGTTYAGPPQRGEGAATLGGVRGRQDEEAVGYRAKVASVGGAAPVALEDIPRSVSVLSQEQMQRQDIQNIGDAIKELPGVTLVEGGTGVQGGSIYARGYPIQSLQIDGGAPRDLRILGNGLLDLGPYERVELLRGPNGVFIGGDSPGGSLNLVRKRPLDRLAASGRVAVGSFSRLQAAGDLSVPDLLGSGINGRIVVNRSDSDFFYENASTRTFSIYGILDLPLSEGLRAEVGIQHFTTREKGGYNGVYRYIDGPEITETRERNVVPDWVRRNVNNTEFFAGLTGDLGAGWAFRGQASFNQQKYNSVQYESGGYLLSTTGMEAPLLADQGFETARMQFFDRTTMALDVRVTGTFETGPFKHDLMLAADYQESYGQLQERRAQIDFVADPSAPGGFRYTSGAVALRSVTDLGTLALPTFLPLSTYPRKSSSSRIGLTIADAMSWETLTFTASVRRYGAESSNYRATPESGEPTNVRSSADRDAPQWRPSFALTWKPVRSLTLYGSYSEGALDQSDRFDIEGRPLQPSTYVNKEVGAKYGTGRWLASLSAYDLRTENVAQSLTPPVLTCLPTGASECYAVGGATVKSRGVDAEVKGEILPGVQMIASYNYNKNETIATNRPLLTQSPTSSARFFATWTPQKLRSLSVDVGARYRGRISVAGQNALFDADGNLLGIVDVSYSEPSYVVFDVGASYQLTKDLQVAGRFENLTNKNYLSTVGNPLSFRGEPRNFMLSLIWAKKSEDAVGGGSYLGDPAKWYAALDVGRSWSDTAHFRSDTADRAFAWKLDDKPAYFVRLGYDLAPNWTAEIEGGLRRSEFDSITGQGTGAANICSLLSGAPAAPGCSSPPGNSDTFSLLGNLLFRPLGGQSAFQPYVGGGMGIARSSVDYGGRLGASGRVAMDDQHIGFAWQALAGVRFRISDRVLVEARYRRYEQPGVKLDSLSTAPNLLRQKGDLTDNSVSLGVSWRFGRERR